VYIYKKAKKIFDPGKMDIEQTCTRCMREFKKFPPKCGHIVHPSRLSRFKVLHYLKGSYCSCCRKYFYENVEVEKLLEKIFSLSLDNIEFMELFICFKTFLLGCTDRVFYYTEYILTRLEMLGWDINNSELAGPQLFYQACEVDDLSKVNLLIDHGIDLKKYGSKGLNYAYSSFDTFDRLVALGVELEDEIIFNIIKHNNLRMLSRVLQEGVDINFKQKFGTSPIHEATQNGTIKMFHALIKNGADFTSRDSDGNTILHYTCSRPEIDLLSYLLESGFDMEVYNNAKETPLSVAVKNNYIAHVQLLTEKGANVNCQSQDEYRYTPLHAAVSMECVEITKILLIKGANINAKNDSGKTPLHIISEFNSKCANLLLEHKADINATDNKGNTPLYYNYNYLDNEAIQRLIDEGADFSIKNKDGESIRDKINNRRHKFKNLIKM
jgi:ankyrin repeat protein